MSRIVKLPPLGEPKSDGSIVGGWWRETDEPGRILCELCPRECSLKPGDRGFCFVRENRDGEMLLTTYGRSTGFCIDPIEKKPLNHFYPGSSVLSFGTAGCNLGCKFCQNWDISKSREVERLSERAGPEEIARAASQLNCQSVAFTYNDPIIWAEYAIDCAKACRELDVKTVAVTSGYISPGAREPFFQAMDAANVDLKAFSEDFYRNITYSHLEPVLDTLRWIKQESDLWLEITNLIIPQENDSHDELRQMCDWILEHVGSETPLHFSAFHPDFRMTDRPATPVETLLSAYEIAKGQGLKYVYVGNVDDTAHHSTYCPHCEKLLIERNWYELGAYHLKGDRCGYCQGKIAGRFDSKPGDWGRKRTPVNISRFIQQQERTTQEEAMPTTPSPNTPSPNNPAQNSEFSNTGQTLPQPPEFDEKQKKSIHTAASELVASQVIRRSLNLPDPALAGAADQRVMGAFVTLKRKSRLRSCCGVLGQPYELLDALQKSAMRTATEDTRFPPISPTELKYLDLEVSLLSEFSPVGAQGAERARQIEIGRHGLTIHRGKAGGLLLPSVATEFGLDAEGFLRQVCQKAGLPTTAWQEDDVQLQTFQTCSFAAPLDPEVLGSEDLHPQPMFTAAELQQLAEHCRSNIIALTQGATPNYYMTGVSDGTVQGVALSMSRPENTEPVKMFKMSMRPGMPLQATLLGMCEAAAAALQAQRPDNEMLNNLAVGLTVLYDSAMHGVAAAADLTGFDPLRRALLTGEYNKNGWIFDPELSPPKLLEAAISQAQVANSQTANIFSFAALSTESKETVSLAPRPQAGAEVRPAAVAGAFYPAEADKLAKMVDQLLGQTERKAEPWPAIMAPHAGLVYSGKIAAAVFGRVEIPETVIVIGPKHTPLGVSWAVAPCRQWAIPGAVLDADPELAKTLCDKIEGLQLDAAAHHKEHAIEVELPFIARLAPNTRVVGIAIGAGSLDDCLRLASGLAEVIRQMPRPPLLVISSDMNHFAPDAENRRLDELALSAIETLDPAELHQTVAQHKISMCGVLPAVIVMETLRQLGQLKKCQRAGYATSADTSGDTSRVVGYAGMLFG